MSTFAEEEPLRTDAQVNLAVLQLHLHLPGPARALDQLERLAAVLRVELEQGRGSARGAILPGACGGLTRT